MNIEDSSVVRWTKYEFSIFASKVADKVLKPTQSKNSIGG